MADPLFAGTRSVAGRAWMCVGTRPISRVRASSAAQTGREDCRGHIDMDLLRCGWPRQGGAVTKSEFKLFGRTP